MAMATAQEMDRGTRSCSISEALSSQLLGAQIMSIRQTRGTLLQEMATCDSCGMTKTDFKYFVAENQVAYSQEDVNFCCRFLCSSIYPFSMEVKDIKSNTEMVTIERPLKCAFCACKCCCYQEARVRSGGHDIGTLKETCFWCVPQLHVYDYNSGALIYKVHPPTCCGGLCYNSCTEGNPCAEGCCMMPFRIYAGNQEKTHGKAPFVGKILKTPKSFAVEVLTDAADTFHITFPEESTPEQKGVLIGTAIFLSANFFEAATEPSEQVDNQ